MEATLAPASTESRSKVDRPHPEAVPSRSPLPSIDPSAPAPKEAVEHRTQAEVGAIRREFEKVYDNRTREIQLLTEWAPVAMFSGTPDGLLT